jgi:hypothetical protein
MTLTLTYLFANNQTSFTYKEASGVPIPTYNDSIAGSSDGFAYEVQHRTFVYNGADNLTIYFACGTGATQSAIPK